MSELLFKSRGNSSRKLAMSRWASLAAFALIIASSQPSLADDLSSLHSRVYKTWGVLSVNSAYNVLVPLPDGWKARGPEPKPDQVSANPTVYRIGYIIGPNKSAGEVLLMTKEPGYDVATMFAAIDSAEFGTKNFETRLSSGDRDVGVYVVGFKHKDGRDVIEKIVNEQDFAVSVRIIKGEPGKEDLDALAIVAKYKLVKK